MPERRGILRGLARAWSEGGLLLVTSRVARRTAEAFRRVADELAAVGAARAIRRAQPSTVDDAIQFVQDFEYRGVKIKPMQVTSEIRSFLELLAADPPQTVLEIGTGRGGTLFLFSRVAAENALLISLDGPDASFGGRPAYKRRGRVYRSFRRVNQRVVYLPVDSHRPETRAKVVALLKGRPIDVLFIDGDHTYEGVEADVRMYATLVRRGGLLAFHDIVPGPPEAVGGVPSFWQQIKGDDYLELVQDWQQGSQGIGVLPHR